MERNKIGEKRVSILVPCYNEESTIPLLYPELKKVMDENEGYDWEILFVNDGSKDDTLGIIKSLASSDERVCYIDLSRNFGKENAMLAGFDYVTGNCMVIIDADLQDPPSLIPKMLGLWEAGYDDVYARRADRGNESWLRKKFSLLFYRILDHSTKFDVLQNVGDFRLLDRKCIEVLQRMRESERYTKGMFCWIGFKKKEIIFDRGNRIAGQSNWNFLSLFNLAIEGITSFTTAPLRIATMTGSIIALIAFALLLFYTLKRVILGDPVQGFTTLVVLVLFSCGIQLLCIGLLGEYIGRIFNETKKRPVYVIREQHTNKISEEHINKKNQFSN